ncbi:hypothetical protein K3495_g13216, partial [Podosphaera aphanis]
PADTFEGVCGELRSSIATYERSKQQQSTFAAEDYELDHHWTDRIYRGRGTYQGRKFNNNSQSYHRRKEGFQDKGGDFKRPNHQKKCFVCRKVGCWSNKHPSEERRRAYEKFCQYSEGTNLNNFDQFLFEFEGLDTGIETSSDTEVQTLIKGLTIEEEEEEEFQGKDFSQRNNNQFFTEMGAVDGIRVLSMLDDQAARHSFTKEDEFSKDYEIPDEFVDKSAEVFTFKSRYSSYEFHGIMPDTGAAGVSTAGNPQFIALQRLNPSIKLDTSTAGSHNIKFGKGTAESMGTGLVDTPLGKILFHVVPTNTPFLWCVQDMDKMGVYLNNLQNVLVQGNRRVPIVRKWGHPFMLLEIEKTLVHCHLTENELRQLHRRFGHPSVRRLERVLQRAGHNDFDKKLIDHISKMCHQCQMHGQRPKRFKFTLDKDYEFNHSIIVDIMYIDGKPVLQVVDASTNFGAARFLSDLSICRPARFGTHYGVVG